MSEHDEVGDEDRVRWYACAPNTGAVFSGSGTGQPPAEATYVKLMPDYSVDVPLWGIPWRNLQLDPALIERLRAWQARFEDHFDHEQGWDDTDVVSAWRVERERLADALRRALGPEIEVQVHPWPE